MIDIVTSVRSALEMPQFKILYTEFEDFPRGSCLAASALLGMILQGRGFGNFSYTTAWRENISHSWLDNDVVTIDITADQFSTEHLPVIFEPKNADRKHLGFTIANTFPVSQFRPSDLAFYSALIGVREYVNASLIC